MASPCLLLSTVVCLLTIQVALTSDVLQLTSGDFDSRIKDYDLAVVKFYAPWCGHCKKLAPEYEKAAEDLKRTHVDIGMAEVDCDANSDLCSKYEVRGYPTMKIFRHGELSGDYEGPRESNGIANYVRSLHGPSSQELHTQADFEAFLDGQTAAVVGFFEKQDSKLKDSYLKVADVERTKFRFAHTSDAGILKAEGFKDDIAVYQPKAHRTKLEDFKLVYDGNYDVNRIKKFLHSEIHGLCGHRTMDNSEDFKQPLVVAYYDVDFERNAKSTNYVRNRMMKVAKDYKREVTFAVSGKDEFRGDLSSSGLMEASTSKVLVVGVNEQNRKFVMKEEFSVDALRTFVEQFLDGKLEPFVKSEPVPENQDGPVTVVVGKTFDDIVNQEKDVLIEFYAPWCGHCKNLAPIYDELGTKMKSEDIVIAKMDATANEVPLPFKVEGFPTIYFAKANDKKNPMTYQGGRDLDSFVKFLAKEASNELEGWDRKGKVKKSEL